MATKKTTKKAAPKATEAKPAKKKPGQPKATGLRKPQVRILQLLGKVKSPLTRKQISERAETDFAMLTTNLGKIATDSPSPYPSLLDLKYITAKRDDDGVMMYSITDAGRKALAALEK